MTDELETETRIAEPKYVRASLSIFARVNQQVRPESVWDEVFSIYEDADTLAGWNRESLKMAKETPLKYLEQTRARIADLGARILFLLAFIDEAESKKPPADTKV